MSDVAAPAQTSAAKTADETSSGRAGLLPPRRSGRSTRLIGEVVVELGLADRETVEGHFRAVAGE